MNAILSYSIKISNFKKGKISCLFNKYTFEFIFRGQNKKGSVAIVKKTKGTCTNYKIILIFNFSKKSFKKSREHMVTL